MKVLHHHTACDQDTRAQLQCMVTLWDLEVEANIGVHMHEQRQTQPLIVSVEAMVIPPVQDLLEETLDYEIVAAAARTLGQEHIALVETFATRLAAECLKQRGVLSVEVSVRKPRAVTGGLAGARVTMSRFFEAQMQPSGET